MKVAIAGASGLVGTELTAQLKALGHDVIPFTRQKGGAGIYWNLATQEIDGGKLAEVDAIVNLAGENIATGRWTKEKKQAIRDSRVQGTSLLAEAIASLPKKPKVWVNASAIGFYGSRGDEMLTETSGHGDDFLAKTCQAWETAAKPATEAGVRVVFARFGIILSKHGGALQKMLLPFQMGGGSPLGSGKQYMSWVSLQDVARAVIHCLQTETLVGPVNVVADQPETNKAFSHTLGRVLCRPVIAPPPPDFLLRLALGEMADALLLSSTRVTPQKLLASGFQFSHPTLEQALRAALK
jgi:uncharacterized protein